VGIVELIGIAGSILLALCGVPQAWRSFQDKHSDGISWGFLNMWGGGEILVLTYICLTTMDWILIANYAVNLVTLGIIMWYKLKPDYNLNYMDEE